MSEKQQRRINSHEKRLKNENSYKRGNADRRLPQSIAEGKGMKNLEVLHTLRLYDGDFIAKLGTLMAREKTRYRNKNEFLTAVLKQGFESYTAAANKTDAKPNTTAFLSTASIAENSDGMTAIDNASDIYRLLTEMNDYMIMQFKALALYQEINQKMLAAIYRMQLAIAGGEKVATKTVETGFYDDLPARFDKIIYNIKTQLGLV
jgi:hypothetical protein